MEALNGVVAQHPRWGFWMCSHRLRLLGQEWNHKRVYRVYKAMKLNLPRRAKRRLPQRVPHPMAVAARANAEWAMDFMADTLDRLVQWRGKPDASRVDNGPEYLSQVLIAWCQEQGVTLHSIQPGKPNQNAYIERFNRTFRHEVLDAYVFSSLREVREITRHWITAYNEDRPHHSLGSTPPAMFRRQVEQARHSTLELSP